MDRSGRLMKVGVRGGKMVVVRPEDDHGVPSYGPDRPRTYVYRRPGRRVGCAAPRSAPRKWTRETCSGAPPVRRSARFALRSAGR